jgi:hypothetical protein
LRAAALEVLAAVGGPDDVESVAERAISAASAERRLAQAALHRMPGEDVDQRIVSLLETAAPRLQVVLIEAVAARGTPGTEDALLRLAGAEQAEIRLEAVRALGRTCPPSTLPALIRLAEASDDPPTQKEIQIAIELVGLRQPDPADCVAAIRTEIARVRNETLRARLEEIAEHLEANAVPSGAR